MWISFIWLSCSRLTPRLLAGGLLMSVCSLGYSQNSSTSDKSSPLNSISIDSEPYSIFIDSTKNPPEYKSISEEEHQRLVKELHLYDHGVVTNKVATTAKSPDRPKPQILLNGAFGKVAISPGETKLIAFGRPCSVFFWHAGDAPIPIGDEDAPPRPTHEKMTHVCCHWAKDGTVTWRTYGPSPKFEKDQLKPQVRIVVPGQRLPGESLEHQLERAFVDAISAEANRNVIRLKAARAPAVAELIRLTSGINDIAIDDDLGANSITLRGTAKDGVARARSLVVALDQEGVPLRVSSSGQRLAETRIYPLRKGQENEVLEKSKGFNENLDLKLDDATSVLIVRGKPDAFADLERLLDSLGDEFVVCKTQLHQLNDELQAEKLRTIAKELNLTVIRFGKHGVAKPFDPAPAQIAAGPQFVMSVVIQGKSSDMDTLNRRCRELQIAESVPVSLHLPWWPEGTDEAN